MPSFLDRQIFRPTGSVDARPEDLGLDYEEVFLTAGDGTRLHAWFFPGGSGVTLVFFHGNAGDISHRLDMIPVLQAGLDVSILLFDYRGYGRSEGAPTERGVYLDSLAAAEWARRREGTRAVVYYGRSLGAAAAIETALQRTAGRPDHRGRLPLGRRDGGRVAPIHRLGKQAVAPGPVRQRGEDSQAWTCPCWSSMAPRTTRSPSSTASASTRPRRHGRSCTPWRAPATVTLFSSPASSTPGASTGSCGAIWATGAPLP